MTRPVSCGRGETSQNQHLVALHEQLDAEHAAAAEVVGDRLRDLAANVRSAVAVIGCGCQLSR